MLCTPSRKAVVLHIFGVPGILLSMQKQKNKKQNTTTFIAGNWQTACDLINYATRNQLKTRLLIVKVKVNIVLTNNNCQTTITYQLQTIENKMTLKRTVCDLESWALVIAVGGRYNCLQHTSVEIYLLGSLTIKGAHYCYKTCLDTLVNSCFYQYSDKQTGTNIHFISVVHMSKMYFRNV